MTRDDGDNIYIDVQLFKRISFSGGVPSIIVDLLCYMTGGCKNQAITELCHKALKILYERVQPIIYTKKDLENS